MNFDKLTSSETVWLKYKELVDEFQTRFELQNKLKMNKDFVKSNYGEKEVTYHTRPGKICLSSQIGN